MEAGLSGGRMTASSTFWGILVDLLEQGESISGFDLESTAHCNSVIHRIWN